MLLFKDTVTCKNAIGHLPTRIVSLVPSLTELLYSLGLEEEVIGITKFCIHPTTWYRTKTRIGGTKNLHLQKIIDLQPHLVIANKEENVKAQVEALAAHVPVYVTDVNTLANALQMIEDLGTLTGKAAAAKNLRNEIQRHFKDLANKQSVKRTAAYLIWKEPYMTVGGDTFINDMLLQAGFTNAFEAATRYPAVSINDLQLAGADVLLLSSEPYPFKQKHIEELAAYLPGTNILLVDGEMFSWYGSRLLHAAAYFTDLQNEINTV